MAAAHKKPLENPEKDADVPGFTKATVAVVQQRVKEVQKLLMQGFTRSYILQYSAKWNLSSRQIDEYISKASEILGELNKISMEKNRDLIIANLWTIFRDQVDENPELARKALMDIAKLRGLDQMTVNHVLKDEREMSSMSDADLDNLLDCTVT